jgi:hypothetical protein
MGFFYCPGIRSLFGGGKSTFRLTVHYFGITMKKEIESWI